ncbi:MAG TPA: SMI1/KNR4 family protein [Pirellulales bacterium]|nr:SMI1/KNR4 family protein [Pirellulales bacterium]
MLDWQCFFPPASDESIEAVEQSVAVHLPPRYRSFLITSNGGRPHESVYFTIPELRERAMLGALYGIAVKRGHGLDLETVYADWRDVLPAGLIPIGEDPGGNQLLLATVDDGSEGILFWDRVGFLTARTGRNQFHVASNIDQFLESLKVMADS